MYNPGCLLTAMVTPFNSAGEVDYKKAVQIADYLADNGSDAIILAGTTGEAPTLTHEEEIKLFEVVAKEMKGKIKVFAGTGSNCTVTAVEMSKKAEKAGIEGLLQVVPYYNKPPQEGLYQHFKAVAESTSLPVLLYNIPGRTGKNMSPATIARLAKIDNIFGLKEASGCLDHVVQVRELVSDDFVIYSGDDALTLGFMERGACGVVSVASHCAGLRIKEMIKTFTAGDKEAAYKMEVSLDSLFEILFVTTNPAPLKYALNLMGFDVGGLRLPLVEPNDKEKEGIKSVLTNLKII